MSCDYCVTCTWLSGCSLFGSQTVNSGGNTSVAPHILSAGCIACMCTDMAEKPEDLSLPASVVARIIKDAVGCAWAKQVARILN